MEPVKHLSGPATAENLSKLLLNIEENQMKDMEKSTIGLTYVHYGSFHMHRH
jgi:hypothetical protein